MAAAIAFGLACLLAGFVAGRLYEMRRSADRVLAVHRRIYHDPTQDAGA